MYKRQARARAEPQAEPAPEAEPERVQSPTPIPAWRIAALDHGVDVQARATVSLPSPLAPPDEEGRPSSGLPWGWALPILGLVGVGAALASTRPSSVAPARSTARASYITAAPTLEGILRAGQAAVEAQRFDEAVAWFGQALKLHPRLPVAHFCLGVSLAALDRHQEAYAALRKAHRLDPKEGAYRLELARAAARTGRHQEAMQQMGPLLRALPDLAAQAQDDHAFEGLRDHPRWLAMLGRL